MIQNWGFYDFNSRLDFQGVDYWSSTGSWYTPESGRKSLEDHRQYKQPGDASRDQFEVTSNLWKGELNHPNMGTKNHLELKKYLGWFFLNVEQNQIYRHDFEGPYHKPGLAWWFEGNIKHIKQQPTH